MPINNLPPYPGQQNATFAGLNLPITNPQANQTSMPGNANIWDNTDESQGKVPPNVGNKTANLNTNLSLPPPLPRSPMTRHTCPAKTKQTSAVPGSTMSMPGNGNYDELDLSLIRAEGGAGGQVGNRRVKDLIALEPTDNDLNIDKGRGRRSSPRQIRPSSKPTLPLHSTPVDNTRSKFKAKGSNKTK